MSTSLPPSMRLLEISHSSFIKEAFPEETEWIDTTFFRLRDRGTLGMLQAVGSKFASLYLVAFRSRYDAVFCRCIGRYIYRDELSLPINLLRLIMSWYIQFCVWVLARRGIPLVLIDHLDEMVIDHRDMFLLDWCRYYFKRELPQSAWNVYLRVQPKHGEFVDLTRHPRFKRNVHKFKPMSIGIENDKIRSIGDVIQHIPSAVEKDIDVFYAGTIAHSTVRQMGLPLLEELRRRGYRVEVHTSPLPYTEFVHRMNRSWLVWSPEGLGWDCFRHYEVPMAGSVPLINHSGHRRYRPLLPGVHCVQYAVEGEDLCEQAERALADRPRLLHMAAAAREYTLEHHTYKSLGRYMVRQTFAADHSI